MSTIKKRRKRLQLYLITIKYEFCSIFCIESLVRLPFILAKIFFYHYYVRSVLSTVNLEKCPCLVTRLSRWQRDLNNLFLFYIILDGKIEIFVRGVDHQMVTQDLLYVGVCARYGFM